jgi:hypothetical protein
LIHVGIYYNNFQNERDFIMERQIKKAKIGTELRRASVSDFLFIVLANDETVIEFIQTKVCNRMELNNGAVIMLRGKEEWIYIVNGGEPVNIFDVSNTYNDCSVCPLRVGMMVAR